MENGSDGEGTKPAEARVAGNGSAEVNEILFNGWLLIRDSDGDVTPVKFQREEDPDGRFDWALVNEDTNGLELLLGYHGESLIDAVSDAQKEAKIAGCHLKAASSEPVTLREALEDAENRITELRGDIRTLVRDLSLEQANSERWEKTARAWKITCNSVVAERDQLKAAFRKQEFIPDELRALIY